MDTLHMFECEDDGGVGLDICMACDSDNWVLVVGDYYLCPHELTALINKMIGVFGVKVQVKWT